MKPPGHPDDCICLDCTTERDLRTVDQATTFKRLSRMKLLVGKTEQITMGQLRASPGDVIAQVEMGKTFTITKRGVAVATITQVEPNALQLGAEIRRMEKRNEEIKPT